MMAGAARPARQSDEEDKPQMTAALSADSVEIDHPTMGPSVAIYYDRRTIRRKLLTALGMVVTGAIGAVLGLADLANGDATGAAVFLLAGAALLSYGLNEARAVFMRFRTLFSLVVSESGFESAFGVGSIGWDEVASVGFERVVGRGKPGAIRVQLNVPDQFAARHALSLPSRLMLRINDGALYVARGTGMPAPGVLDLMSDRLAEFRRTHKPPPAPAQRIRRRTSRR
jgi:hypothetical protein